MPLIAQCHFCNAEAEQKSAYMTPDGFFDVNVTCGSLKKRYIFCAEHAAKLGITADAIKSLQGTDLLEEIVERVIEEIGERGL